LSVFSELEGSTNSLKYLGNLRAYSKKIISAPTTLPYLETFTNSKREFKKNRHTRKKSQ